MAPRPERPVGGGGTGAGQARTPEGAAEAAQGVLPGRLERGSARLPLELTSFVDRRVEVTEARRLLGISRLVTLTGIGGVGKTRLAVQVVQRVRAVFPGGSGFVELAELHDESLLAGVVAEALGLRAEAGRTPFQLLVDFLRPRQFLLVLDNCEQIARGAAVLVEGLLRRCPGLRVMATSREVLGIDGEALLPVPPLQVPAVDEENVAVEMHGEDALSLFAARAADVVPGFTVTDENYKGRIANMCCAGRDSVGDRARGREGPLFVAGPDLTAVG